MLGDARVQQIAGGDDGRFDAVADGYDRRVEIGGVDLLQRHHVGHVGLHGGDLRRPAVHQFAVLVDGEHILPIVSNVVATELPKRPSPTTRTLLVLLAMIVRVPFDVLFRIQV